MIQSGVLNLSTQADKKDIRLIAIDMDGTLLNSEHVIPEENKQAIKEAEAKGV
ncbi:HAD hydrolase family protein, partial [Bacillus cereus]|nr:HAD hydrolase family protein [Bacillus cereus]